MWDVRRRLESGALQPVAARAQAFWCLNLDQLLLGCVVVTIACLPQLLWLPR
eukprot:COSAG06_NODE_58345_length_277_cov_0.831461_1_plen_51_part_01